MEDMVLNLYKASTLSLPIGRMPIFDEREDSKAKASD
jgi:hypothetical protein